MYLYRKMWQAVTLAAVAVVISSALQAQFRTAPRPERKTARAIGVLETFKNGSRRLVPVTFFYEGHYYDATFYRATPVPMALDSETVYEVQQFGNPVGTFTVLNATERPGQSAGDDATAWFGNGHYRAAPDAAALAKKKAAAHRMVVVQDSSKPVLHRRAGSEGDNPVAHSASSAASAADSNAAQEDDDPDRPRLHRSEASGGESSASTQTSAQAPAPAQAPGGGQDSDRPKLQRRDETGSAAPEAASSSGSSTTSVAAEAEPAPSGDSDHPILRRGKPLQEQSGRDLPDFNPEDKPSSRPDSANGVANGAANGFTGTVMSDEDVTRQVAVSDAGRSEPQPLIYICREEQRKQMEADARELAKAELRRVAAQRGLVLPEAAKPAALKTAPAKRASVAKKKAAAQATTPELNLREEQFVPYDLDYNDYATVVFSARYVPESASAKGTAGANGPASSAKSWVVTVIAREDDGKLVKLYSAVSDPKELDLYPEVRLVDAVDPDGYGRYGLLFREQKRDGVSWLLGRTTGYELQTIFETPER